MGIQDIFPIALTLVLVVVVVGLGVLITDKFANTTGVTLAANTTLQAGRDAIGSLVSDWLALIVLVVAAAIIIGVLIRSFGRG